jgi:hypothetical protein
MSEAPNTYSHVEKRFDSVSLHFLSAWHHAREITVNISLADASKLVQELEAMLPARSGAGISR